MADEKSLSDECKQLKKEVARLTKELARCEKVKNQYLDFANLHGDIWGCPICERLFPSQKHQQRHEQTKTHKARLEQINKESAAASAAKAEQKKKKKQ